MWPDRVSNQGPLTYESGATVDKIRYVTRTRTRVGKPALGFYESLENIYSSKTNVVKHINK